MKRPKRYYGEEAEIIDAAELFRMRSKWSDAIARMLAEGPEEPPAIVPVYPQRTTSSNN